jgi:1,4-dihydroxy-6-naphthoate synthase
MFHHIAREGHTPPGVRFIPHLHDVETLNQKALQGIFDVSKVSFHAYLRLQDSYQLLQSGAALGRGCGPLVVSRKPRSPDTLPRSTIAVPGELTTGHLLLRLWLPAALNIRFVPYDRILPMLLEGTVDAGVIIHESRFVYQQAGMHCVQDLGEWWEQEIGLPIPLGGIVAHRRLGEPLIESIDLAIQTSIRLAQQHPDITLPYVREFARELDDNVLRLHIQTFVNEYSTDLGSTGKAAIARLETMARKAGLIP